MMYSGRVKHEVAPEDENDRPAAAALPFGCAPDSTCPRQDRGELPYTLRNIPPYVAACATAGYCFQTVLDAEE